MRTQRGKTISFPHLPYPSISSPLSVVNMFEAVKGIEQLIEFFPFFTGNLFYV